MRAIYENLYALAPITVQSWMISSYGRKLVKQRYGEPYRQELSALLARDYGNFQADRELQDQQVVELVQHAIRHSRFYKKLYADIEVESISGVEGLGILPVVDKELLRENIEDVYTIAPEHGIELFTGGTTGKSLRVVYTPEDFQKRMAYLDAFKVRCGIDPFAARKATFSGRSFAKGLFQARRKIFWRDNLAYNQRLYSTFDLMEENIPYYLRDLARYKPDVLNGFVSALHQLAVHVLRSGESPGFRPKAIFTTSETLLPHLREAIQEAFGAHIYDQYGSAEGATFVTECRSGKLHYNIDTGVIETQDFGVGPEMLITSFTTHGTPLIRYRIGDRIVFSEGSCDCGSAHPLVERIDGRAVDYLFSPERGRVSLSHLADVIKGLPNCVKEMQFVQEAADRVAIHLVVDESLYGPEEDRIILAAMRYRFGDRMEFPIRRVTSIAREASGKFALIKNLVSHGVSDSTVGIHG
jgi:phenylacetate-CoA ligase